MAAAASWSPVSPRSPAAGWEEEEAEPVEVAAARALGCGFDLTNDFRLRFVKGLPEQGGGGNPWGSRRRRLVELDEENVHDVGLPGGGTVIHGVPKAVGADKGDRLRFRSDVLEFNQMSELLNQKSSIQGKVPSGYFNALFDLSGAWLNDTKDTRHLAFDGYFISLYNLHLRASPLVLREEVKRAVPPKWDPPALSRFIQMFGTHIIVEMAVGGQDVLCVRQTHSSKIPTVDLKMYLEDLGDVLFSDGNGTSPIHRMGRDGRNMVPDVFQRMLHQTNLSLSIYAQSSTKDGLTVISKKRGGESNLYSHSKWLQTVTSNPDVILFKFVPITSLLTAIPGSGYLSHAINLYLRYKPDVEDLQHFLEFQVPLQWSPLFNELALGPQKRKTSYPVMQFRFLGPKLHINTSPVSSGHKLVTGLRLYLEGQKCDRLAIHIQHLSSGPSLFVNISSGMSEWQSSENSDSAYIEPIQCRSYSCICTSVVKHDPQWLQQVHGGVFVVTGAQLTARGRWPKKVLHLRLLFTHVPNCTIRKTEWARSPAASQKGSFLTTISTTLSSPFMQQRDAAPPQNEPAQLNSGVYPDGPPVPVQSRKLLKFVDLVEVVRGPHDPPGHWLVTAAKLVKEGGKVGLHVKFSLLNYPSPASAPDCNIGR